jgi:hypothetical protein
MITARLFGIEVLARHTLYVLRGDRHIALHLGADGSGIPEEVVVPLQRLCASHHDWRPRMVLAR